MKEETSYAMLLYKFGEGDTKPVKNVKRLSELSGAPVETLRPWLPKWRKECEQLAITSSKSPYSLSLSEDVLAQHRTEIDFLAQQVEKLRRRLDKLTTDCQEYHLVLNSYSSALTKWEKSSGIVAHFDTAAASMKETARAKARAEAKSEGTGGRKPKLIPRGRFDVEG